MRAAHWLCLCPLFVIVCTNKTYNGYALFNIQPLNQTHLDFLRDLWSVSEKFEIDVWQLPEDLNETAEVMVAPAFRWILERELIRQGIVYNISNEDIQRAIEEEQARPARIQRNPDNYFNFSQYNNWDEIERYLSKLPHLYPDLVEKRLIGQSHENRDLILLKIGKREAKKRKQSIWIDSGIHAREWISVATVLYMVDSILSYYEGDETIQRYLDNMDWYFLPVLNPDGYAYTHTKDRMWRKNRSPAVCKGRRCCQGVDLNRNFATQWGVSGASKEPCSEVYQGPKPFSEPETKAVRDFVTANAGKLKAYFSFHSYGQLWMHPFGYKKRTYPDDVEELRRVSLAAVENMRAVHGTRYRVGTAANILYPTSGGADDWAKAETNVKYVFSVELRPTSGHGNGFILHPRNIIPSGEETWAGIRVVADTILSSYGEEETTTTVGGGSTRKPRPRATTTPPEHEPSTTSQPEEVEGSGDGEEPCFDLSTRCAYFEEQTDKCGNNVVKAICKKMCLQC